MCFIRVSSVFHPWPKNSLRRRCAFAERQCRHENLSGTAWPKIELEEQHVDSKAGGVVAELGRGGTWRGLVGVVGSGPGAKPKPRRESRALAIEALESRALLAVTFQLNFVADGAIGFNDATNGAARKAAPRRPLPHAWERWFHHTATVQVDMRNDNNAGDNYLAEVTDAPAVAKRRRLLPHGDGAEDRHQRSDGPQRRGH